jgi:hypothetical protein
VCNLEAIFDVLVQGARKRSVQMETLFAMFTTCIPRNQAFTPEEGNTAFSRGVNQLNELQEAVKLLAKTTSDYTRDALRLQSDHKLAMAPQGTFKRLAYNFQRFDKVDFFEHGATRERLRDLARLCKHGENELQYFTRKVNSRYRGATTSISSARDERIQEDISRAGIFGSNLAAECRPLATAVSAHFAEYWLLCREPALDVPPTVSLVDSVDHLENVSQSMR